MPFDAADLVIQRVRLNGVPLDPLRRGFSTWATRNQWSPKALMEYVGWRDVHSALRYVEADTPFGDWRREPGESK